jgi:uncharacterized DUF497 family protein
MAIVKNAGSMASPSAKSRHFWQAHREWRRIINIQRRKRGIAVGRDTRGRPIFVAFTMREQDGQFLIRPISARYMPQTEIEGYEKESSKVQDR